MVKVVGLEISNKEDPGYKSQDRVKNVGLKIFIKEDLGYIGQRQSQDCRSRSIEERGFRVYRSS